MDYTVHIWDKAKMALEYPGFRLLTYSNEAHNNYKFWGVKRESQNDRIVTVWGRIGKKPQYSYDYDYGLDYMEKKVEAKKKKGYVEICENS